MERQEDTKRTKWAIEDLDGAINAIKNIPFLECQSSKDPESFDIEESMDRLSGFVSCLEYLKSGLEKGFIVIYGNTESR